MNLKDQSLIRRKNIYINDSIDLISFHTLSDPLHLCILSVSRLSQTVRYARRHLQTISTEAGVAIVDITGVGAVVIIAVVVEFAFSSLYTHTTHTCITHNRITGMRMKTFKNRKVNYSHHCSAVVWNSCEFQMMQLNVNMVANVRGRLFYS